MSGCKTNEIATTKQSRNYIQFPDPVSCGRKLAYYGVDCQWMQVGEFTRTVRNSATPIYTWNRRTNSYCAIASTSSPPENPQITVDFYDGCDQGLPLSHALGECRLRIIINHGICGVGGALGFGRYAEVFDVLPLSEARSRRTSYDGADEPLSSSWTMEVINQYDISTMVFSQVNLSNSVCAAPALDFNDATFGCQTGCGQSSCGCTDSCDDGTMSMYFGASCPGGTAQYVAYTVNGGSSLAASPLILPAPASGVATQYPKTAVIGDTLYVLAYEEPPTLFSVSLDSNGLPTGAISQVATLGTTGVPGSLIADGDTLHILVEDATNGSRYYTLSGNQSPSDGPVQTFAASEQVTEIASCGDSMIMGGAGGTIKVSSDGGSTWTSVASPSSANVTAVGVSDRLWVAFDDGSVYTSSNNGSSWTQSKPSGLSGNAKQIAFAGDDIGWIVDSYSTPMSTWLGGINSNEWSRADNRLQGIPAGFTPEKVITPDCAGSNLVANTALLIGTDASGNPVAYIGRSKVTGI